MAFDPIRKAFTIETKQIVLSGGDVEAITELHNRGQLFPPKFSTLSQI